MEKQIVVKIGPDGSVQVLADGFAGPGCVDAVRHYAQALGLEIEAENLPEFYQVDTENEAGLALGGGW